MPMEDVRFITAQRIVLDSLLTEERQLVLAANSVIRAKDREIQTLKKQVLGLDTENNMLTEGYQTSQYNLQNCGAKNEKLRTWAAIGRGAVVVVGVSLGFVIIKSLTP